MNRRSFVATTSVGTGAALLGGGRARASAEPPPEITGLRLMQVPSMCLAPQYVAEDLLHAEGFADVSYVEGQAGVPGAHLVGEGQAEIAMNFAAPIVMALDAGARIVVLAGVHVGCFELFGTERIRTIRDLKNKTVAVFAMQSGQHVFLASMMTQVGLNPRKDVRWVVHPPAEAKRLLAEAKIDGYLGFPPDPQELRDRKIGRVVVNSAVDRPWSQYFCCMVTANREFVQKHPVAAKRALRAILKGDQICAVEPDRAVRAYQNRGYSTNAEYARQAIREIRYGRWREFNPEETVRFYALRLREAGMIKGNPQQIISRGTDWRFVNELKKELKG